MHTPNHRSRVSAATYKTAGSTPIRETLGPFLNFHHPVPETPVMFDNHPVVDMDYTDNNYNSLINSAEMINQNYDAQHTSFDPSSQDFDLNMIFDQQQQQRPTAFAETTTVIKSNTNVATVVPTLKINKKNMGIKNKKSSSSSVESSSSSLKHRSSSPSSTAAATTKQQSKKQLQQQTMSPLKKRMSKEKRVSMKGMGAAMKRIRMSDAYDGSDALSSSEEDSSDEEMEDIKNDVIVVKKNADIEKTSVDEMTAVIEDPERILIKPKSRGRYAKKMCVSSAMKPVHVEKPTPSDPATDSIFREIITKQAKPHQQVETSDKSRMFTSHILDTSYYMFIVSKSANVDEVYTLRYINCVHSVHNEYTAHHMHHDRFVLVVTLERYRFMISYNLLIDMNIEIPIQDQFSEKQLSDTNKNMCIFEEVKDFKFMCQLINTFHLDQVYIQGKISLLLASVGEKKARVVHEQLTQMMDTKMLFTLPLSITKKEAPNQEELKKYDMSMYVEDIMKYTTGLYFKKLEEDSRKITRAQLVDTVAQSLSFWYENKQVTKNKNNTHNVEKSNFTYKYGCITRQFYDPAQKGVKKLYKVKKENGSAKLIENYLNACKERFENHSFILITTKSDERITIIKKGMEFLWITSVIKDIVVTDIIKKYRMYNHYIYNLNNGNRKEINIRHNGMIKLLSNYTGERLTLNEIKSIAVDNFGCNFEKVIYDKKSAQCLD
ncbi:IE-1 [Spodoptera cosmioides nucleopolyhedrovirus]|uniref:IE-1 n=1 Tax=Spodoptera cosmioides nucleopolyhedrovirus TaxID=2605774 RepID=A0A6B7KGT8_9ABAC|nr:IE-1 [Spodoptera cosmioides nucleopolyhedrovirus]